MWTSESQSLEGGRIEKTVLISDTGPITYGQVIEAWVHDSSFRGFFSDLLTASAMAAYYWEVRPTTRATLDDSFEFVLIDSPELARIDADPSAFRTYLDRSPEAGVVTFRNLGGDAELVVPRPLAGHERYPHLSAFLRAAPPEQTDALWRAVGTAMGSRVGDRPTWLSTAGLGVPWTHVRLDSRPKYYRYQPYRSAD